MNSWKAKTKTSSILYKPRRSLSSLYFVTFFCLPQSDYMLIVINLIIIIHHFLWLAAHYPGWHCVVYQRSMLDDWLPGTDWGTQNCWGGYIRHINIGPTLVLVSRSPHDSLDHHTPKHTTNTVTCGLLAYDLLASHSHISFWMMSI